VLDKLTGSLQISTITGQVHTGALLIFDPQSQIVVLSSQTRSVNGGIDVAQSNPLFDIQIIKVGSIKDIHRLPTKQDGFKPYEAKPITLQELKVREEVAQKRALDEERRLGVGASVEGQKIFDAFVKTYPPSFPKHVVDVSGLPVRWVKTSIMVTDEALINPPYTLDSVVSVSVAVNGNAEENGGKGALTRVRHIVYSSAFGSGLTDFSCNKNARNWGWVLHLKGLLKA
jgi:protein LSM12